MYYNSSNTVQADYRYAYNADGILAKQYRVSGGNTVEAYTFEYDSLGRLIRSKETGSGGSTVQRTEHLYDTANRLTSQSWVIGSTSFTEGYTYHAGDGSLATMEAANGTKLYYTYDGLKRLQQVTTKTAAGASLFYSKTVYKAGEETNQTTNLVSSYGYFNADDSIRYKNTYTYDSLGNITQINEVLPGGTRTLAEYTYDNENQLTQEIRYSYTGSSLSGTQTTVTYTYDTAGNLLQSTDGTTAGTIQYTYSNNNWADLLTGIKVGSGTTRTIQYDGGNPTNWYNGSTYSNLTWTQGRRLSSLTKGNASISYTYDMAGIRTSKTDYSDDVRHEYITQSGKVVRELVLEASTRDFLYCLDFFYDAAGRPYAMRKYVDEALTTYATYHYLLNAQGDVMGLFHQDGTIKATYTYDAWGNVLTAVGDLADVNPLRYRGYYYDRETGWYYLQSRYYDPIVKRFLSTDIQTDTNAGVSGLNLFVYCANNPVNFKDASGNSIIACIIVGAVIGAVVGGLIGDAQANAAGYTSADGWNYWQYVVIDGIAGAVVGAAAGYCVGAAAAATTVATSSAALSAYASWAEYVATHPTASGSYYIGKLFEGWFYEFFGVAEQYQQVRHINSRFDAIINGVIYELKNYDWSKYSSYNGIIKSFVSQAMKYLSYIGSVICGERITGVVFYFSSEPPAPVREALEALGIIVDWVK